MVMVAQVVIAFAISVILSAISDTFASGAVAGVLVLAINLAIGEAFET